MDNTKILSALKLALMCIENGGAWGRTRKEVENALKDAIKEMETK